MDRLTASLDWFTHGWHAFVGAWLVVLVGMWAGLWLRGANKGRFLTAPIAAAVVALLAMLAAAALKTGLDAAGIAGPLRAYGTFAVFPLFGLIAGLLSNDPAKTVIHRGAVIQDGRPAQRRGRGGELTLAGIPIPAMDETKHFKMIGTTGTGKSTAIRELLEGALARGDRAVIADPDGGYLARFYDASRGDVILNPFDPRAHTWNIYGELTASHDVEQLARSLIPDHDGADKSWRGYARTFFTALARQTNDAGIRDLNELYRLITCASTDELRILTAGTPAQPFLESGNERMFGSIRSVTGASLTALDYLAEQKGPPVSVRDWVRTGRGVLFLPYQADQIAALRSIISAWLRLAIFQTMTEGEGDKKLWFIVDELDALGPIDGLEGRARAPAQVRRPLRARISVHRPGLEHLRTRRSADHRRELQQHPDPPLLRQRERRHGAIRIEADRRTRSHPPDSLPHPQGRLLRRTRPQRQSRRTTRDGVRRPSCGDRTAARPCGLPEVRQSPCLAARAPVATLIAGPAKPVLGAA